MRLKTPSLTLFYLKIDSPRLVARDNFYFTFETKSTHHLHQGEAFILRDFRKQAQKIQKDRYRFEISKKSIRICSQIVLRKVVFLQSFKCFFKLDNAVRKKSYSVCVPWMGLICYFKNSNAPREQSVKNNWTLI